MSDQVSPGSRGEQGPKRKRDSSEEDDKLDRIANALVEKAKKGMKKINKDATLQPRNFASPATGDDEDTQLCMLEKIFDDRRKAAYEKTRAEVWMHWYCAACVSLIRHLKGYCKRDRRASGAFVVNGIVDQLLKTEGTTAFVVLAAYAGEYARQTAQ